MTFVFRLLLVAALAGSALLLSSCEEPSPHRRIYAGRPAYYQERPRYREGYDSYVDERPYDSEIERTYPAYGDRDYGDRYHYSEARSYPRAYGEVVIREREYPERRYERERRERYRTEADRYTYRGESERSGRTDDRGSHARYRSPEQGRTAASDYRRTPGTGGSYRPTPLSPSGARPPYASLGRGRGASPPAGAHRPGQGQPSSPTQPAAHAPGNGKKKKVPQT